jgi:hypothetical protein
MRPLLVTKDVYYRIYYSQVAVYDYNDLYHYPLLNFVFWNNRHILVCYGSTKSKQ